MRVERDMGVRVDGWVGVNGWMDRAVNSGSTEGWVSG